MQKPYPLVIKAAVSPEDSWGFSPCGQSRGINRGEPGVQVVGPGARFLLQPSGRFLGFPPRQSTRTVANSVSLLRSRWKSKTGAFLKALTTCKLYIYILVSGIEKLNGKALARILIPVQVLS